MKTSLLAEHIREVKDFPKEGISFKDITPILSNPKLSAEVIDSLVEFLNDKEVDAIVGVESRGFLFGILLAYALKLPFIPVRKAGKLPHKTIVEEYALEYGTLNWKYILTLLKKVGILLSTTIYWPLEEQP